jgi:ribonuclease HI
MSSDGVFTIHTDGGARGNPGPAAYAYVIERPGAPDIEVAERLGNQTNNFAEYTALLRALEHAKRLGARRLDIRSDSDLMVNQLKGSFKVKHPGLIPLHKKAKELWDDFEHVDIRHIRREYNTRADALYNAALDGDERPPTLTPDVRAAATVDAATVVPASAKKRGNVTASVDAPDKVHKQAVAYLSSQAEYWAEGDPDHPDPQEVWEHLWKLLKDAGAVK